MIHNEDESRPKPGDRYDVVIAALGFERRSRYVAETESPQAHAKLCLEFGFLKEASFEENLEFFDRNAWACVVGVGEGATGRIKEFLNSHSAADHVFRILIDVSSMSREMIANVAVAVCESNHSKSLRVTVAYAPSRNSGSHLMGPIRSAGPLAPGLAGWSARPDLPLGCIVGLGCERGLALGALQYLEPKKTWTFAPIGIDPGYTPLVETANSHISDIFDVTQFRYEISGPVAARARLSSLVGAIASDFRIIVIPNGPKIFAWLSAATVLFEGARNIGVWSFSSKEEARVIDREAEGPVIWHSFESGAGPDV